MAIFKKRSGDTAEPTTSSSSDAVSVEVNSVDDQDHRRLGITDEEAIEMYREMLLARILDQKTFQLNRMGKAPFMISSQGHEAVQIGTAHAINRGHDIVLPYYRDLALMVGLGLTPYEALLGIFARADDPSSGGRQMPNHWGYKHLNVITGSSPIATHLPHAAGIALDIKNRGSDEVVLCTFGDGATSKGDFHEAMNFAGIHKLPIVFLCENNGYAISVPLSKESAVSDLAVRGDSYNIPSYRVDGNDVLAVHDTLAKAWAHARAGEGASFVVANCYRFLSHTSDDDDKTYRDPQEVEAAKAADPLGRYARYLIGKGLITEDNVTNWTAEYSALVDEETTRAEARPVPDAKSVSYHVVKEFEQPREVAVPRTDASGGELRIGNYIDAIRSTMEHQLATDPRVIILGEDVGKRGGVFRATADLAMKFGENRVLDTPLAESSLVGIGIGLALNGARPIVEIQFADFIHSAFDQILSEAARIHYRSNGDFEVPMVIRAPYGGGVHGALYHSQCIEAFYAHIPGLKVVAPSTPADAVGLLNTAMEDPNPILFLEHKRAYRAVKGVIPPPDFKVPIGRGSIVRKGRDLTIITYGFHRHLATQAAEELADIAQIEVVDLRTISPLDRELIVDSVSRCSKVLIVHEDNKSFGVGAEVAATITEHAFWALDAPIARLAMDDVPSMGFAKSLEEAASFGTREIKHACEELLRV
jgi:2-oxoisovalerate dehydrogenase E1 component